MPNPTASCLDIIGVVRDVRLRATRIDPALTVRND
jgi:hypothetical protein